MANDLIPMGTIIAGVKPASVLGRYDVELLRKVAAIDPGVPPGASFERTRELNRLIAEIMDRHPGRFSHGLPE